MFKWTSLDFDHEPIPPAGYRRRRRPAMVDRGAARGVASHHTAVRPAAITRLQRRGYVRREPDPNDGRYTNAVLTGAGYNHLVAAAPGHVATVLELVIDALDDTALSALQDSAERITARINEVRAPAVQNTSSFFVATG